MFDLSGKTALVTGANTGLGQGMALALAEAGADIALIGRTEPTETLQAIVNIGVKSHSIKADLESANDLNDIIAEVITKLGGADILVNNAGIIKRNKAIDFTPQDWDVVMNVNLRTLFFLSQAFARHLMEEKRGGKIINIASMLTFQGGIRVDEKRNAEILGRIPSGRWGKPSDLDGAVVFLASEASDYVQGITLPVDGGWLSR